MDSWGIQIDPEAMASIFFLITMVFSALSTAVVNTQKKLKENFARLIEHAEEKFSGEQYSGNDKHNCVVEMLYRADYEGAYKETKEQAYEQATRKMERSELSNMEIDSMTVMCAAILDGIVVTYADGTSVKHGENGGWEHKISLQGDSIQRITGVYNVNFAGHKVISQLRVETKNGKKYGPFGDETNGSPFALEGDG